MTAKIKTSNRIMCWILSIALLITCIPMILTAATTDESAYALESDPSTIDTWQSFFPVSGDLTTANAGAVWTDKSVFKTGTTIDGKDFTIGGKNNFLVALSAIGSNMSVTGKAAVPTDTVMVLDTSGSMEGAPARAMINAVNVALNQLMEANPGNRVAIVFFDSETTTYLPLAHYQTSDSDGRFLNINNSGSTISLNPNVTRGGNSVSASSRSWSVVGGTYTALGLKQAMNILTASSNVLDQDAAPRIPVVMLFSDGIPTYAANNFTNPPTSEYSAGVGNGQSGSAGVAEVFATELTAAYVKSQIAAKYGSEYGALFYTLGKRGTEDHSLREAILDPVNKNTTALNNAWRNYNALSTGSTVTVDGERFTKISTELSADYVDGYFDVDSYQSGTTTLEEALKKAFNDVVAEIVSKSVYSPTLLEGSDHNLSGYVSFVDKLGSYMRVADIKGIMTGGILFTGTKFAEEVYKSSIGQLDEKLASELQASIAVRLNITVEQVRELLYNAWNHGQIAYNPQSGEYSDWFGWLSDAQGAYLGVWYEGMEIPVNAAHVNKSFIYLGIDGDTNMMYTTVRIREKVNAGVLTGEQDVAFAVPASLLPKITYAVDLDQDGNVTEIKVTPETPIHLIYEVGLDPEINPFNVRDKVSASYLSANTDPATGEVYFYTNEWNREGQTGYGNENAYSYFRPSRQNDRYYYQSDSLVYSDTEGTVYNGSTHPSVYAGKLYYYHGFYTKTGSTYNTVYEYHELPKEVLSVAAANGDGTYTIKAGTIRDDWTGDAGIFNKLDNTTGTLPMYYQIFCDTNSHSWDDVTHSSIAGITLGNNGRLSVTPESGIKIAKELAPDVTLPEGEEPEFLFDLTYPGRNGRFDAYSYRYVNGELLGAEETVTFLNGKASVTLKAGESIYVGGMTTDTVTVTERTYVDYVVQSVSIGGSILNGTTASVTLAEGKMQEIVFVNTARGTGNFTVAKEIIHNYGVGYTVPENGNTEFEVELTFIFDGKPLSGSYVVAHTDGNETEIKLDGTAGETVKINLHHDDQFTVYGLPEGTVVTAVENLTSDQQDSFTPTYDGNANEVTVKANTTAQVIINNIYEAKEVAPTVKVSGTKTLTGNAYSGSFTFVLQKYNGTGAHISDSSWTTIEQQSVTYENSTNGRNFAFDYDFSSLPFDEVGTYIYRVKEEKPAFEGMVYDTRIHTFQIDVTDNDMDGKLEASVSTTRAPQVTVSGSGNAWEVKADFVNEYTNDHVVTVRIDAQKEVENPKNSPYGTSLAGFEFGLYNENGQLIESLTTTSVGSVIFSRTYKATDIGTHVYTLKEIKPTTVPTGWDYTDKEVKITVVVSQVQGENHLQAVVTTDDNTAEVNGNDAIVTFTNTYEPKDASLTIDFVSKTVTSNIGSYIMGDGEFSFELYEVINGVRGSTPVATGKSGTDGKVTFNKSLTYNKVGEHYYEIVEVNGGKAGMTYDPTVYKMIVHVTDNGQGQLVATPVIESVANNNIVFKNVYTVAPAALEIEGSKTLTGRPLLEHDFQFILAEEGTSNVWQAMNGVPTGNTASFSFPKLTFTKPGTYTYEISEYDPSSAVAGYFDGVKYDDTVYTVVVTVTDNGQGQLVASYTVDGDADKKIEFVNEYTPDELIFRIIGTKALLGRDLRDGEFTFDLYKADYNVDTHEWTKNGASIATANNALDGSIVFGTITADGAGTYRYIVTERNTGNAGVTFDTTEWRVAVNVADDQHGNLSIESIVFINDEGRQNGMVFENTYTATEGALVLSGIKTLNGRNLEDGEFSFTLYNSNEDWATDTEIQTVANGADGSFTFDEMTFEAVGTYYFLVKENAGNAVGVTYDESAYRIKVEVTDDASGALKVEYTVYDEAGEEQTSIEFVNTFTATSTNPDTNDNIIKWLVPAFISGAAILAITKTKKKKHDEEE